MARSKDDDLWTLTHAERSALAEDLIGRQAKQWRHQTLCGEWDVEQVVAHLTEAASTNQWQWLRSMIGARFRPDVHNQRLLGRHLGGTHLRPSNGSAPSSSIRGRMAGCSASRT